MSIEAMIISHVGALLAGVFGTYGVLRNVAGWKTAFEHSVANRIAVIEHAMGLHSVLHSALPQIPPLPPAASAPIGVGGAAPSPSPGAGPPQVPVL